jgi:hypothetical protein
VTAALVPFSHALSLDRPSLNLLVFLFVLGLPILVTSPQSMIGSVSDRLQKVLIAMSLLVTIAIALALLPVWNGSTVHQFSRGSYGLSPSLLYYQTDLVFVATWLLWIDAAAIAGSAALFSVGRRLLAGSVALGGLPLLVLWFGFRYLSFGFRYNESTTHLLVGIVLGHHPSCSFASRCYFRRMRPWKGLGRDKNGAPVQASSRLRARMASARAVEFQIQCRRLGCLGS